jgi:hypothetical protein
MRLRDEVGITKCEGCVVVVSSSSLVAAAVV